MVSRTAIVFLVTYTCAACIGCAGRDSQAPGPTTAPSDALSTSTQEIALANSVLRSLSRFSPQDEAITERYGLVRYRPNDLAYAPDGRPRYVARVVVDGWTHELIELRGDYAEDEIARINRYRPADIMTVEQALAAAVKAVAPSPDLPPPSGTDVDLVAKRYYVVRFVNGMASRNPNTLTPDYSLRIVIDGRTGEVLSVRVG
jgi:hypothetical protein